MRKTLTLLASAFMGLTLAAHADTYTYTYTATKNSLLFSFTSPTVITADLDIKRSATISGLTCTYNGAACQNLNAFISGTQFIDNVVGGAQMTLAVPSFAVGSYIVNGAATFAKGTFTVTDNPAAAAATPEPSSLILLGTGILGLAGAARRRFLNA